jgi:predicted bacteriocin transport accessory protein
MDNKKEIIIMSAIAVIVVIGAVLAIVLNPDAISTKEKKYKNSIEEEADKIKKSEMIDFDKIDIDKYLDLYKGKDTSIVMIGRSGCEYCQIAEPIMRHVGYKYKLKVYYLSLDSFDDDAREKLLKSDKYFQESGGVSTPMVMIVKKKKIVAYLDTLSSGTEYVKFFKDNGIIDTK